LRAGPIFPTSFLGGRLKVWHDPVFVLEKPDGAWRTAGRLPRRWATAFPSPRRSASPASAAVDARRHYADVFLARWEQGEILISPLPSLPKPIANSSGAMLGEVIYVAGNRKT